ncbi:MAG: hypothetical protein WCI38_07795 [Chthoniobacterales bacterium]|jgi:hypothetical protein
MIVRVAFCLLFCLLVIGCATDGQPLIQPVDAEHPAAVVYLPPPAQVASSPQSF